MVESDTPIPESEYEGLLPEDEEPLLPADESQEPLSADEKVDLAAIPGLMKASDLLPKTDPVEAPDDVVPPTPEEADLMSLPLAERERRKLQAMTPEQRMRYGQAQIEIESHPTVQAFAAEEDRIRASKEQMSKAYIDAMKKKAKEKT